MSKRSVNALITTSRSITSLVLIRARLGAVRSGACRTTRATIPVPEKRAEDQQRAFERFGAWLESDAANTRPFTSLDEYLLMKFMSELRLAGAGEEASAIPVGSPKKTADWCALVNPSAHAGHGRHRDADGRCARAGNSMLRAVLAPMRWASRRGRLKTAITIQT